jgi:hypothetical protein
VARIWDHYIGGAVNSDVDRDAARIVLGTAPDVPLAALENRVSPARHRLPGRRGRIRQFIDIGPACPAQGNVHQIAHKHAPDARRNCGWSLDDHSTRAGTSAGLAE